MFVCFFDATPQFTAQFMLNKTNPIRLSAASSCASIWRPGRVTLRQM